MFKIWVNKNLLPIALSLLVYESHISQTMAMNGDSKPGSVYKG